MIVAFSIAPAGPDDTGSYAAAVAEAVRIVRASGLPHETNAMFTNIEGEWDEVMAVLKQCVDAMTASHPRVSLVVKADIRPGHTGELESKVGQHRRAPRPRADRRWGPTAQAGGDTWAAAASTQRVAWARLGVVPTARRGFAATR